ncbi:hypothetical protein HNP73_003551 [Amaricoccus macauensis]|uniref:Uncharacterized protein n=1 Tax=Amaricoccus macauensis TaxID=57001 RepID=A0A840SNL9_9RHOB|nr:hypothetical protein [Amaricoccus macauensis]MBB5223597.1 hypothetical protein [Amaricoccus macauensis]
MGTSFSGAGAAGAIGDSAVARPEPAAAGKTGTAPASVPTPGRQDT